jgi:hypothetical protein
MTPGRGSADTSRGKETVDTKVPTTVKGGTSPRDLPEIDENR